MIPDSPGGRDGARGPPRLPGAQRPRGPPPHRAPPRRVRGRGPIAIAQLLRSPYPVRSVLASQKAARASRPCWPATTMPLHVVPQDEMERVTRCLPPRPAGQCHPPAPGRPRALTRGRAAGRGPRGPQRPRNLGALFRNARAFGVEAVLLEPTADLLTWAVVRVSQGHVLHVPWYPVLEWPNPLADLRAAGFDRGADPDPAATPLDALAADPPARVALLLGAESSAPSDEAGSRGRRGPHPDGPGGRLAQRRHRSGHRLLPLALRRPPDPAPPPT